MIQICLVRIADKNISICLKKVQKRDELGGRVRRRKKRIKEREKCRKGREKRSK